MAPTLASTLDAGFTTVRNLGSGGEFLRRRAAQRHRLRPTRSGASSPRPWLAPWRPCRRHHRASRWRGVHLVAAAWSTASTRSRQGPRQRHGGAGVIQFASQRRRCSATRSGRRAAVSAGGNGRARSIEAPAQVAARIGARRSDSDTRRRGSQSNCQQLHDAEGLKLAKQRGISRLRHLQRRHPVRSYASWRAAEPDRPRRSWSAAYGAKTSAGGAGRRTHGLRHRRQCVSARLERQTVRQRKWRGAPCCGAIRSATIMLRNCSAGATGRIRSRPGITPTRSPSPANPLDDVRTLKRVGWVMKRVVKPAPSPWSDPAQ